MFFRPEVKCASLLSEVTAKVQLRAGTRQVSEEVTEHVQLRVLSEIQEGAALLPGAPLVHVKEVDVSTLQLDRHKSWTHQVKELLSSVQHQGVDVVFVSLPANKQGLPPLRGKLYPYGLRIPLAATEQEKG